MITKGIWTKKLVGNFHFEELFMRFHAYICPANAKVIERLQRQVKNGAGLPCFSIV